jgi:hypothetical protein
MAPGFEDRLRSELERAAGEPTGGHDVYEQVLSRKARRGAARRVQSVALVVAVLAGTVGGAFGLAKAFNLGAGKQEHEVATGPAATNGRIAFVSNRDGNNEIYSMEPDGGDLRNLTNDPASDTEPAWSPHGSTIAFISDRDGIPDIYVMNADGSDVRRITTHADADPTSQLAWSPFGDAIAFTGKAKSCKHCGWAYDGDIWAVTFDGTRPRDPLVSWKSAAFEALPPDEVVGVGSALDPAWGVWGRGGSAIVFVLSIPDAPTRLIEKDRPYVASELRASGLDPAEPSVSPGGDRVALFSQLKGLIWTMSFPSGAGLRQLDPRPAGTPGNDFEPAWSPDGQKIAFASTRDVKDDSDPNVEIYVMNADGTHPVRLTDDPATDDQPSWQPVRAAGTASPGPTAAPLPPPPALSLPKSCDASTVVADFDGNYSGKPDGKLDRATVALTKCLQQSGVYPYETEFSIDVLWGSGTTGVWPLPECQRVCQALAAADLTGDGLSELVLVVDSGASTLFVQILDLPASEAGPVQSTVAPPGTTSYPAHHPLLLELGGSVPHQAFFTCEEGLTGPQIIATTMQYTFSRSSGKAWKIHQTVFALDGTLVAKILSTSDRTAPVHSSPPPLTGTECFTPKA